jgi:hypothetical protein
MTKEELDKLAEKYQDDNTIIRYYGPGNGTVLEYNKTMAEVFKDGWNACMEQMMKEAVEGWVAVDSDTRGKRRVTFFPKKPVRDVLTEYKYWAATYPRYESIELDSNAFPNLKWEDEPKKIRIIIVKED